MSFFLQRENKMKRFTKLIAAVFLGMLPLMVYSMPDHDKEHPQDAAASAYKPSMSGGDMETGGMALLDGVFPISISRAEQLLGQENVYFFDANTEETVEKFGYIPGAIYINEDNWTRRLPEDKSATLVFYCLNRLCYASSGGALTAQKLGYKRVYVMLDGIEQWILSGNPVVKIEPRPDAGAADDQRSLSVKNDISKWIEAKDVENFTDGIHRDLRFGKIPACRDCHGSDGIKTQSANNRNTVNTNCVSCHEQESQEYIKSVHGQKNHPGESSPNCSDCHAVHIVKKTGTLVAKHISDAQCGACHQEKQEHYHETFHGKAMVLNAPGNAPEVAACYDCHGSHRIFSVLDSRSTLAVGKNRIETCAKCHQGSNINFADFMAHADHSDGDKYPQLHSAFIFMTILIVGVFGFFGIHTLLWSIKLILMRMRHPKAWKAAREAVHRDTVLIKRFSVFHRCQHFFMVVSFLGLSFTGLPQKFYESGWAKNMMALIGDPITATKLHHGFAVVMILVFLSHIAEVSFKAWKGRARVLNPNTGTFEMKRFGAQLFGPDSLMPRWQDFKDMWAHMKWFANKGERPQFDRWTYWEKFDYLAVFWGMFIIGISGSILWFPAFFTNHGLPGWGLNLATLVHSDEALLATGFIFAIHFFNTHFRADRFPMDTVIFSGVITSEEMKEEKRKWYDRLKDEGALERLMDHDNRFSSWELQAKTVGLVMLLTGMILLLLMIYAFLGG
jgi:cytochrome b subunit of formate dehydrogenase/rhodanese-related sulfurtransferase